MNQMQTIALLAVAAAALYNYLPQLQEMIPSATQKSPLLQDLETVTRIRKTYNSEEVSTACQKLLEALLQVRT